MKKEWGTPDMIVHNDKNRAVDTEFLNVSEPSPEAPKESYDKSEILGWVKAAQGGDRQAFEKIWRKYKESLFSAAFRIVRSETDAQDVLQDTAIKAFDAIAQFNNDSKISTWLYRIASNTAKNDLAFKGRDKRGGNMKTEDICENQHMDFKAPVPEGVLMAEDLQKILNVTIEGLTKELREAIKLREFEGLSYNKIAAEMNCPVGTVRSRIARAREIVKEKVQDYDPELSCF